MKRLCALILALVLLLSAAALASVTLEADKTTLEAGQTVYVTVKLDAPIDGVRGMSYDLYYNSDLFDYTPAANKAGDAISGAQASAAAKTDTSGKNYVLIAYLDMTASGQTVATGTLYTLAFTAKSDVTEDTQSAFELKQEKVLDASRAAITTASADVPEGGATIDVTVTPPTPKVTGITLDKATLDVNVGSEETLTATVTADEGTAEEDKTVTWTSSDESVATVADGKVTGVKMGYATVTAKAGEFTAQCVVSVKNAATDNKYSVEMNPSLTENVMIGDSVTINVLVKDNTRTTYNAVDMQIKYDAAVLKYAGDATVSDGKINDDGEGIIKLVRYGSDAKTGEALVALKFAVLKATDSEVTFASAKVDESANANTQDAPEATVICNAKIKVSGYNVTLPDEFEGAAATRTGEDYTFTAKDTDKYDYSDVKATVGGKEVEVKDNGDGTYTIAAADLTGDVTITANRTGKSFTVNITGEDTTGEKTAQYGTDYTFKIDKKSGYTYTVYVSVPYKDNGDGTYTISGSDITKDITISVTKTAGGSTPTGTTTITITGVTADEVVGGLEQSAANGADFKLTLNKDAAYDYVVKVGDTVITPNEDGSYTIPGSMLNGTPLTVSVTKTTAIPTVEVVEYLKLKEAEGETSGRSMWLVLVSGKPVDGNVYAYDDNAMFKTEGVYGDAYYYLMISGDNIEDVRKEATAKVTQKSGTASAVSYEGDVNSTSTVDINDAQLVYDMYNHVYEGFTDRLAVENFLRADMDGGKSITVQDAALIVAKIHEEFKTEE